MESTEINFLIIDQQIKNCFIKPFRASLQHLDYNSEYKNFEFRVKSAMPQNSTCPWCHLIRYDLISLKIKATL